MTDLNASFIIISDRCSVVKGFVTIFVQLFTIVFVKPIPEDVPESMQPTDRDTAREALEMHLWEQLTIYHNHRNKTIA